MTSDFQAPSQPLFSNQKLLKISDLVKLNNLLLIHDLHNAQSPSSLSNTCILANHTDFHETRGKTLGLLVKPQCRTTKFGLNSVSHQSISNWNELQLYYKHTNLSSLTRSKFKSLAFDFLLQQYST